MTDHPIHQKVADALGAGNGFVPVGGTVLCDHCDTDLTDDPRSGGFIFGSKGYGPCCSAGSLITIEGYGEQSYIRAWCPEGVSFADWIRGMRGPDAGIRVIGVANIDELRALLRGERP